MGLLARIARARLGGQVIRRLRRAGFTDARYDARGFRVRFTADGDETPTILELAPLLAARGRRRKGQVDRFVAGLVATPGLPLDWTEARSLLRPVLRGGTPGSPLRRPVLPFLFEYVVVDQPDTMTYVGPDQPAGWGVSAEEVFAAARTNLSAAVLQGVASEPIVVRFVDDGDAYWTSHLLLEHWLEQLKGQVGGVPVAFAPERGTLLVTADGSEHLRGLFAQAEEIYAASARPITPMAYGYDERGCTVPYNAPPGHPLHQAVRRAERVLAVHEYARQAAQPDDPPPDDTADGIAQLTPPNDAAHGLAQLTPPNDAAHGLARLTPPKDAAHGLARLTPPDDAADGVARLTPPQPRRRRGSGPRTNAGARPPVPMAELRLVGSDEHGWRTRALWEHDEATLLPEADEVQVGDQVRAWHEVLPHLRPAAGYVPARWSADGWPPS